MKKRKDSGQELRNGQIEMVRWGQNALRWTGDKGVTRMTEDRQVKRGET